MRNLPEFTQKIHFAAVIDYSRRKNETESQPYDLMIYEIQNLYSIEGRPASVDSRSGHYIASGISWPSGYMRDDDQRVLDIFGMPSFTINPENRLIDQRYFVTYLFDFKEFQRLCLAANPFTARWIPKTFICYIKNNRERGKNTSQLRSIYINAFRFLKTEQWILKTAGAKGAGNRFVDAYNFDEFCKAVHDLLYKDSQICLIEEVINLGKKNSSGFNKTYRALVHYNIQTGAFRMQNIHGYLTRGGSVDSHQAELRRHYTFGDQLPEVSAIPMEIDLDSDEAVNKLVNKLESNKIARNTDVAQYKPGLFNVFRALCQHVTQSKTTFWDPLMANLEQYTVHPLYGQLLFHDLDPIDEMRNIYLETLHQCNIRV